MPRFRALSRSTRSAESALASVDTTALLVATVATVGPCYSVPYAESSL